MADRIEQHTAKRKIFTIVFTLTFWPDKHNGVYTDVTGHCKTTLKQEL